MGGDERSGSSQQHHASHGHHPSRTSHQTHPHSHQHPHPHHAHKDSEEGNPDNLAVERRRSTSVESDPQGPEMFARASMVTENDIRKSEAEGPRQSTNDGHLPRLSNSESLRSTSDNPDDPHNHLVRFKPGGRNTSGAATTDSNSATTYLPPLPPGAKNKTRESTLDLKDDLARASWTTASFTELPNALDELTQQHHPSKTVPTPNERKSEIDKQFSQPQPKPHLPSTADLHSILVKRGPQPVPSILTKYLKPSMSDEGTQAGIPSWDWLARLEQMLIRFFILIFESSGDASKLVMELMPTEAGTQVEEIFQLLLKAEPDMYKELGHLVNLAEKWLIIWKEGSEERQKALDYVRLYMKGVKDKNYYKLPVQVRLHKLGTFIAGLKTMGKDGEVLKYPVYKEIQPVNPNRVGSPRVKPATHFSRVVANILCARPCDEPFPVGDVYADKLGRNYFKNTLHGDQEFKDYTDQKYGRFYNKQDLFAKRRKFMQKREKDGGGGDGDMDDIQSLINGNRDDCIENVHCWLPLFRNSYVNKLEGGGCEMFAQDAFTRGVKSKADYIKNLKAKSKKNVTTNEYYTEKVCKDGVCKMVKKAKSKKLYEWVPGPDGKVHRRLVGSYTEIGGPASVDRMNSKSNRSPGRHDPKKNHKFSKGKGFTMKAVSDSNLVSSGYGDGTTIGKDGFLNVKGKIPNNDDGKDGFGSVKGKSPYASNKDGLASLKGKSPYTSNIGKDGFLSAKGKSDYDDKSNRNKKYDAYNMEVMSVDGSGDGSTFRLSDDEKDKKGKTNAGQNRGKAGRFADGTSTKSKNHPSEGTQRGHRSDKRNSANESKGKPKSAHGGRDRHDGQGGHDDGHGGRNNRLGAYGGRGDGYGGRGDHGGYGGAGYMGGGGGKDKDFVDIYKKGNQYAYNHGRRDTNQSYRSRGKYINEEYEGEGYSGWSPTSDYYNFFDKNDEYSQEDQHLLTVNQCWEKASKLFKKPNKSLIIPPTENLLYYLEKKFPKSRWPRGTPLATRNYPNGSVFVAQYSNGASRVYYPHGGLAVSISAPSPVTSHVLVVRDPSDQIFFFDKALLADLNTSGKGTIFGEDGVVKAQYSAIGGFKLDGQEKGHRWQWNQGGQRLVMKLNRFMSLRISDQNRIFLNFYGNMRGFLVNVASGREVFLMNAERKRLDPLMAELKHLIRPRTVDDHFDYTHGRFNTPNVLGIVERVGYNYDYPQELELEQLEGY